MPARRKTPGAKGAAKRSRPRGSPGGEFLTWYQDRIEEAARAALPTGYVEGMGEELLAYGAVAHALGVDPNAVLRDALVRTLRDLAPAPRAADEQCRQVQAHVICRIVRAMADAARASIDLPENGRLEAATMAVARELGRDVWGLDLTRLDPYRAAKGWLQGPGALAYRFLLGMYPHGRTRNTRPDPQEAAVAALRQVDPALLGQAPPVYEEDVTRLGYVVEKIISARKERARRIHGALCGSTERSGRQRNE